jgi:hypothetical protein
MYRFILLLLGTVFLFASTAANATIVKETWTATVSGVSNSNINTTASTVGFNGFSLGDEVSWTVTYDTSKNDRIYYFLDGLDGQSDRGHGDDLLEGIACVDLTVSPECSLVSSYSTALHEGKTDASNITENFLSFLEPTYKLHDYFSINRDHRIFKDQPHSSFTQHDYYADYFRMYADNRLFPSGGAGSATLFYEKTNSEIWVLGISFLDISYNTVEVSVPPTILLMLSGLFGLGLMRWKTLKQQLSV